MYEVLIVPYGIETCIDIELSPVVNVLIVPYGIETTVTCPENFGQIVLIVPYGIETVYIVLSSLYPKGVNCTLWN